MAEHWSTDAGAGDVATLEIPPDAKRDRRFEIDCRFVVRSPEEGEAWHAMRVSIDGAQQWSRRIATANRGSHDSLDLHLTRDVPAGRALRIVAATELRGAQRVSLRIEAEEGGG
jgi:hypothetical protein